MAVPFIKKDFKTHLTSDQIAEVLERRNVYNLNGWKIPRRHEKDYYIRLIEKNRQYFIVEKYGVRIKGNILSGFPATIKLKVILNAHLIVRLFFVTTIILFPFLSRTIVVDGIRTEPDVLPRLLFSIIGGGGFFILSIYLDLIKAQKWLIEKLLLDTTI